MSGREPAATTSKPIPPARALKPIPAEAIPQHTPDESISKPIPRARTSIRIPSASPKHDALIQDLTHVHMENKVGQRGEYVGNCEHKSNSDITYPPAESSFRCLSGDDCTSSVPEYKEMEMMDHEWNED